MYNQFLRPNIEIYTPPKRGKEAYIFDIDGTLAIRGDRGAFDWSKVHLDTVNKPVREILWRILDSESEAVTPIQIIIFSGRSDICKEQTQEWLRANKIEYNILTMRKEGDNRKDSIVKKEMFDSIKGKYKILGVFDDRNQVVEMWRSLGLTCFQVAEGDF